MLLLTAPTAHAESEGKHCRYVDVANLPVKFVNGRVMVEGTVNNQAASMMIDTGAQFSLFSDQEAEKLGLHLMHSGISSVGLGGESATHETVVDDIALDKLHSNRRMHFLVAADIGVPFGMVVGADILLNKDLEISPADQQIKFFEPSGCDDTFLAYWDVNASDTKLEEISSRDHRRVVPVEINGHKMRALIDSGSQFSFINLAAAARAGVTPDTPGVKEIGSMRGVGTHQVKAWLGHFDTFSIGEETTRNANIGMMDLWGNIKADLHTMASVEYADSQPDMLLGADFLRSHHVLFALSQHRFYFSYLGGKVFDYSTARAGAIQAGAVGKQLN